jgi:hypothetical protein
MRAVIAIVVTVLLVAFLLEFGRSELLSQIFTGMGLPKAIVIGAVVVLAILGGWYFWATSPRRRGEQPTTSDRE